MDEKATKRPLVDLRAEVRDSTGIAELLTRLWLLAYRRRPAITVTLTVILLAAAVTTAIVHERQATAVRERLRAENLSYDRQVAQLAEVETHLKGLIQFVSDERNKLGESQRLLEELRREKERLEPVVQADRKAIEALLELREHRAARSVWKERVIGFGLGVLASVFASFIYAGLRAKLRSGEATAA